MTGHLVTTPATAALCRCGALILTGHAEGLRATVDPHPLTAAGHTAALLAGRWTYRLTRTGLVHLDATRITDPKLRGPTLADHRCGQPPHPNHIHHTPTVETHTTEGIPY